MFERLYLLLTLLNEFSFVFEHFLCRLKPGIGYQVKIPKSIRCLKSPHPGYILRESPLHFECEGLAKGFSATLTL